MRNLNLSRWNLAAVVLLLSAAAATALRAEDKPRVAPVPPVTPATQPPKNPGGNPPDPIQLKITELLKPGDAPGREQALPQIQALIQTDARKVSGILRGSWLKSFEEAARYDDVNALCWQCILAAPDDGGAVEEFLTTRTRVLLLAGKKPEALAVARQYYNYTPMKNTGNAILLVSQCLNAAFPEDRDILKKFRMEQVAGSQSTTALPADKAAATVLSGIALDPHSVDVALHRWMIENYKNLTMRGNLMLLAGRGQESYDAFERAYTVADAKDLTSASENLARAMKARDGGIGPANAWIASIRPKPQASLQDLKIDATAPATPSERKQP